MRFNNSKHSKPIKEPKAYEEREVVKFLLFPKRLRLKNDLDNEETRWLEKANIQQFYSRSVGSWIDFMWMDE